MTRPAPSPDEIKPSGPGRRLHPAAWSLLSMLALGVVVAAFYATQDRHAGTPELEAPTTEGGFFVLSQQRGQVVVLDFFQVYCESCTILEGRLKAVAPEWNESQVRLVSVGVAPDNDVATLRGYQDQHGLNWTVASDAAGTAFSEFEVIQFPTLIVVDVRGEIVYRNTGLPGADEIRQAVTTALAQSAAPVEFARYSLWGLAVVGAVASFFSPCAIGLLPGYVAHTLRFSGPAGSNPLRRALGLGLTASLGILLVFLGIGALAYAFGRAAAPWVRGLAPFAGLAFVLVGVLLMVRPYSAALQRFFAPLMQVSGGNDPGRGTLSHFLYGVGYGAGAAGCTAPVLLNLVALAATAGPATGVGIVLAYAGAAALLLTVVTLVVAGSREGAAAWIRRNAHKVEAASAVAFVGVGLFLLWFAWRAGRFPL